MTKKLLASIPVDEALCRLLALPPELRTRIYEYVLAPKFKKKTITRYSLEQPPLLRTCKTIRAEARSVYYHDQQFQLDIKNFDSSLLQMFSKQTGQYLYKVDVEIKIMRSSKSWSNLLAWLEAYHKEIVIGFQCDMDCGHSACCAASLAFDLVANVRDDLCWKKTLPLLELFKKGSEQRCRWN